MYTRAATDTSLLGVLGFSPVIVEAHSRPIPEPRRGWYCCRTEEECFKVTISFPKGSSQPRDAAAAPCSCSHCLPPLPDPAWGPLLPQGRQGSACAPGGAGCPVLCVLSHSTCLWVSEPSLFSKVRFEAACFLTLFCVQSFEYVDQ